MKEGLDLVVDRVEAARVRLDTLLAGKHGALSTNVEGAIAHTERLLREALGELVRLRREMLL